LTLATEEPTELGLSNVCGGTIRMEFFAVHC
jgi:hypothetical protein